MKSESKNESLPAGSMGGLWLGVNYSCRDYTSNTVERVIIQTVGCHGQHYLEVGLPRRSRHVKDSKKTVVFEEAGASVKDLRRSSDLFWNMLVRRGTRNSQKNKLNQSKMLNAVLSRSSIITFRTKKPAARSINHS